MISRSTWSQNFRMFPLSSKTLKTLYIFILVCLNFKLFLVGIENTFLEVIYIEMLAVRYVHCSFVEKDFDSLEILYLKSQHIERKKNSRSNSDPRKRNLLILSNSINQQQNFAVGSTYPLLQCAETRFYPGEDITPSLG